MNTFVNNTLRLEVAGFLYTVATKSPIEISHYTNDFLFSLEKQTDPCRDELVLFVNGVASFFQNNYQQAISNFSNILQNQKADSEIKGIAYLGLGLAHRSLGNLDEAVSYFFLVIDHIEKGSPFHDFLVVSYHQLGDIHITINDYPIALEFFKKSFANVTPERQFFYTFRVNSALGDCYRRMKEYEKSRHHLMLAMNAPNLLAVQRSRGEYDLGLLYLDLNEFDEAKRVLQTSLETRLKNGQEDAASTNMIALAEVNLEQNHIQEAIDLLQQCLVIVEKYATKWKKVNALFLLGKAYQLNQNFEQANFYYEKYIALHNETKSEQERKILKFKNEQIEKQRQTISQKHAQLMETFAEIKRLKVNRKAVFFSWVTIIVLVLVSELFLDPFIENYAYNGLISLSVKVLIALLFKPLDGLYEKILWERTLKKVD